MVTSGMRRQRRSFSKKLLQQKTNQVAMRRIIVTKGKVS